MISEKLKEIREKTHMNKKEFAEYIGIKYTTYNNYETGTREPSSDFLILISSKFDVSIDYILGIQSESEILHSYKLKANEYNHIENYRKLDPYGKDLVDTVISKELKRIEETNKKTTKSNDEEIVYINFAQNTASAGSGDVLFGDIDDTPLALVGNRITNKADFAVRVNGDSMLPDFSNGDIVLASKQPVDNGDIGLFVVNGNGYIKKKGSRELISLNPKFDNVQISEYDTVYCMGKVIGKVEDEWMR